MKNNKIENLRAAMGTLPSQKPEMRTDVVRGVERLKVELVDYNVNPYKSIVEAATATWGNDKYESKWPKLTPENRFKVTLAAVSRNTLPGALEAVKFTWRVIGLPRHAFDQHARARIGTAFYSIGSRDNSKLDASLILYTKLYDKYYKRDPVFARHINEMKEIYAKIVNDGQGTWQIARAFLPLSYHHPYVFSQNYLALQGQCARRMKFCEEEFIVGLHWMLRESVKEKFPLLADYLRPGCDYSKQCDYAKSYSLSNAFGCLFASCGRWPAGTTYATFNESCTDKVELEKQLGIHINDPDEWMNLTEDDYDKLDQRDKKLFEAD